MKHVVDYEKIKATSSEKLLNEVLFLIATLAMPIFITAYNVVGFLYDEYYKHEAAQIEDTCRIQFVIPNDDGTLSYGCKSEKHTDVTMLLQRRKSSALDENPYIYRPVKIYKSGRIK